MSEQPTGQIPVSDVIAAQQDSVDELVAVVDTQQAVLARQDQQIEALTSALEAALNGRSEEAAAVLATVRAPRQEGASSWTRLPTATPGSTWQRVGKTPTRCPERSSCATSTHTLPRRPPATSAPSWPR